MTSLIMIFKAKVVCTFCIFVGTTNNLLSVQIGFPNAIATCSFLSGFTGSAYCRVDYGTSPDSLEYSATSHQMGSAGESVVVYLDSASYSAPGSPFHHVASFVFDSADGGSDEKQQCVHVIGNFLITQSEWLCLLDGLFVCLFVCVCVCLN